MNKEKFIKLKKLINIFYQFKFIFYKLIKL